MGGSNDEADKMNDRLEQQQRKADAEVESRRVSLARTRMDIVKSLGTPQWENPDAPNAGTDDTSQTEL